MCELIGAVRPVLAHYLHLVRSMGQSDLTLDQNPVVSENSDSS